MVRKNFIFKKLVILLTHDGHLNPKEYKKGLRYMFVDSEEFLKMKTFPMNIQYVYIINLDKKSLYIQSNVNKTAGISFNTTNTSTSLGVQYLN